MSVGIEWRFVGDHSAVVSLTAGDGVVELATTYVRDSFSSLLQAAADLKAGAGQTFAVLAGEPKGSVVLLSGDIEHVIIEIVAFSAMSASLARLIDGRLIFREIVDRNDLIRALVSMGHAVLETYGVNDYSRRWGRPFPLDMLNGI
jgi:hypothetical protein